MATFRVKCGMRPDSGRFAAYTSASTMWRTVTVEARNASEAPHAAIDECYKRFGNSIEHVRPLTVTEIEGD